MPKQTIPAAGNAVAIGNDPDLLNAYFHQVRSYGQTTSDRALNSARLAWCVAGAAVIAACASAFAVASLAPLKTVEDRVFRVDNTTGAIERVYDLEPAAMSMTEASKRFSLWQYVRLREGYNAQEAKANFDAASRLSSRAVQAAYARDFNGDNPDSPQVVLGTGGGATLRWVSTSFMNDKLAQVRFVKTTTRDGRVISEQPMVATVGFDFLADKERKKLKSSDFNVNPNGWVVTSYHADLETGQ